MLLPHENISLFLTREEDIQTLRGVLEQTYHVSVCPDESFLQDTNTDLIVVDKSFSIHSAHLIEKLRESGLAVLFLQNDEEITSEMEKEIDEIICLPINKTALLLRIKTLIRYRKLMLRHIDITNKLSGIKPHSDFEHFRTFFDRSLSVMLLINPVTWQIVEVNQAAAQFYGWDRETLLEMEMGQINVDHSKQGRKIMDSVITLERLDFNIRHRRADESIRDLEVFSNKVSLEGQEYLHFIIHDITDQLQTEASLKKSEERFRSIVEGAPDPIFIQANDQFVYMNKPALKLFGAASDSEILGTPIMERFHPDYYGIIKERINELKIKHSVPKPLEQIFIRLDGSQVWVETRGEPINYNGMHGGLVFVRDITERKKDEEEIGKLNCRLHILIRAIRDLSTAQTLEAVQEKVAVFARKLIGADGATIVLRENENCYYADEDAISPLWKGKRFPLSTCISGWAMMHHKAVVIKDIYQDERIPIEAYRPTFVKSLVMVPVNTQDPIGAIGNYWKDSYVPTETEMQLLQTLADAAARSIENIQLYAELEKRVEQRTAQLEAVNKELETFTYSVSHDLKAPLRGIDGYSKLLLDIYGNSFNDEARFFIETLRNSTLQMNQLIEDLLEYSRLERSLRKKQKINILKMVNEIISSYNREINESEFTLNIDVPDAEITADSSGLNIALRNVVGNAIKFTKDRPNPHLSIELKENAEVWILTVRDNGIGFDMKYHQRIFEIFQRLHRAEDFPGTGIGLAMVHKAMQQMQGNVRADSTLGEGSTFYLEIPRNN